MSTKLALDSSELKRQHEALESVFSLIRSLGTTLDVEKVAKLSLLTVTGQLLVRKAAFYLQYPEDHGLRLCQALGVRRVRLSETRLTVPPALRSLLREQGGVTTLKTSSGLSPAILAHFEYATFLDDGDRFVGLLLLGGKLSGREFDEQDERLLQTMGMVMGTALQKALVHQQVAEAMARLQSAEALRKAIIDHVSHEFNTPLLVIKDSIELLENANEEMQAELIGMHTDAVNRLQSLVRGILLVSDGRDSTKDHDLEMGQNEFENAILNPLVHRGRDKGYAVSLVSEAWSNVRVELMPSHYALSLESIIDNAWNFRRDDSGWIVVNSYATTRSWWDREDHVARIGLYNVMAQDADDAPTTDRILFCEDAIHEPASEAGDGVIVVEVFDGGIGVPEGELERIFEPFTQAKNSPTMGVRGAGMGLTAARKLLRDMGGDVVVHSTEGLGSMFTLFLPAISA